MGRRRKITRKQIAAVCDLLDQIEAVLPTGSSITISDDEDQGEIESQEDRGLEVYDVDVVIDTAVMEFQDHGILPKRKKKGKGTYSLSAVFEVLFGEESPIVELATDLETTLSGYEDMIWIDDAESALDLIKEIRGQIKQIKETKDAARAD
jgi:hypothetical protein